MAADFKSYEGFAIGSYVARKGRLCEIKDIDWSVDPPTFTVFMLDTRNEVGTEFDRLQPVASWKCAICTASNVNIAAFKCSFCGMNRKWDETLTLREKGDAEKESKEQKEDSNPNSNSNPEKTTHKGYGFSSFDDCTTN